LLTIAFKISPFRFNKAIIKDYKVLIYLKFSLNNINSFIIAIKLGGKSSKSFYIKCIIVISKSL
jgi:hypothetical protein